MYAETQRELSACLGFRACGILIFISKTSLFLLSPFSQKCSWPQPPERQKNLPLTRFLPLFTTKPLNAYPEGIMRFGETAVQGGIVGCVFKAFDLTNTSADNWAKCLAVGQLLTRTFFRGKVKESLHTHGQFAHVVFENC